MRWRGGKRGGDIQGWMPGTRLITPNQKTIIVTGGKNVM
jgi:hypothetical protein